MKCPKCEKEIDNECKFCSNCGGKVESKPVSDVEDLTKLCSKVWYILGYVRAKSTDEELKEFERSIKNCDDVLYDWYLEVVDYWKNWAKEHNEKNKKKNGSERTCISEIEDIKT